MRRCRRSGSSTTTRSAAFGGRRLAERGAGPALARTQAAPSYWRPMTRLMNSADSMRHDARRILTLELLPGPLAICRFAPDAPVPAWASGGALLAIVRTKGELSVTCAEELIPPTLSASRDWRALELRGPFDHGLVGILLDVAAPLARAKVSIMP